jgi:N-acetyl sugar amidotransferase
MSRAYQICVKCVMDTSDKDISFDSEGICSHCRAFEKKLKKIPAGSEEREKKRQALIAEIKTAGVGKKYDCILGVSGGVDSTYVSWLAAKEGLRCLAVHLDNGWNSELAVGNIEKTLKKSGFELYTHVINWREFRDIQRAYFKSSVIDIEAPTDHAITAILYFLAKKHGLKHILSGSNTVTEGILPVSWGYNKQDAVNLLDIHKRFGKVKLKTFPVLPRWRSVMYREIKKIRLVPLLDYYDYNKQKAKQIIQEELGWVDYGGKHYESVFTRFYQAYILNRKYHVDKRRAHLSTLINSGQMTREEALEILEQPAYEENLFRQDYDFVLKKLDYTPEEFEKMMSEPEIPHEAYKYQLPFSLDYPKVTKTIRKLFLKQ